MKRLLFTAVCAAALSLAAEEITLAKAKKLQPVSQKIPVDGTKDHILTLKTRGGSGKLHIYFFQFNGDQRRIGAPHVWGNAASLTELVGPAVRGATEFTVKDASQWKKPTSGRNIVAFDAKADLSDLPNLKIDYYVKDVTKQADGTWKIEMKTPLRRSHPAGTLVRQHYDGGHLCVTAPLPADKPFTATIRAAKGLGPYSGVWSPGVKLVQLYAQPTADTPVTITEWSLKPVQAE
ncbi:MAG: hypothetical protein IJS01_14635 [Lentisphaeria bacterium]|nr:hypothetical protein [Lentisphaeria bacterium]